MKFRNLEGRKVLVTGASSGIGWNLALQLAAKGAHVLATARREERLSELADAANTSTANRRLTWLAGDITQASHRSALRERISQEWGQLDVLINNAGSGAIGRFDQATEERLRKIFEVNFFAPAELTRFLIPLLARGQQPAVMMVGSVLAYRGVPRKSEYCAAKAALRILSQSLHVELMNLGVDVLQVHPSTTKSEFFDALTDTSPNEKSASIGSMMPEEVARRIIKALERSKREVVLSTGGRLLVWAATRFPRLLDRILAKHG